MPERDPAGARAAATGNESSPGQVAARFEEGRDERITRYGPLVKYVVRRLAIALPPTLDYADLLSFGTIGLIQAVDRFDPQAGVKFENYAITRIRGAIIDALRTLDRLPRSVRDKAKRLDQVSAALVLELGREPSNTELADALGMPLQQLLAVRRDASWVTVSLDRLLDPFETESDGVLSLPADPNDEHFTELLERREALEELAAAVRRLPGRDRIVLALYYEEGLSMREIARVLSLSESRVSQIHAWALRRLRLGMAPPRDLAA